MNSRLNIQDLSGLLSAYTGKEKGEIERFLREFVQVVSAGVYADKLVKVKGLGTFKLILVEKRESIHVNTGERFLIPAHYKFSFLPDKELRELVNKPFSVFETTEINDSVNFSDVDESVEEKDVVEDESVEEVMPEQEIPLLDPVPDKEPEKESEPTVSPPLASEKPSSRKSRGKNLLIGWMGLVVVLLVVLLVYVGRDCWKPSPVVRTEAPMVQNILQESEVLPSVEDSVVVSPPTQEEVQPKPLGQVRIRRGDRLTVIALSYYGNKLFWVYIYQHNKAIIADPNNIPIGTLIEIPAPELYGIDAKSRASREKAAALQTEILTGG